MFFIIAIISILIITFAAWFLPVAFLAECPLCIGVSVTWLWLLAARFLGYSVLGYAVNDMVLAMLMGGSVVGLAFKIEKSFTPEKSRLLWKILFVPMGFTAVYSVLQSQWIGFALSVAALLAFSLVFMSKPSTHHADSKTVKTLEDKMKDCC